jgi:flavin-dependent dehydrogenase
MLNLLDEGEDDLAVNEIRRFVLTAGDQVVTIPLEQPDLVIERAAVISALAARAVANGAEICTGESLVGLEPQDDGVTLLLERPGCLKQRRMSTSTLVGADGSFSQVARLAGWPKLPTVPLLQGIVSLPRQHDPYTARVWFDTSETPYFYWLIPDSESTAVVGLIGEDGCAIRGSLDRFLHQQGLSASAYQGGRIPRYDGWTSPHRKLGGGDVYLVGDAAGQAKVTTVGGIVTGFKGAMAAAEAIASGNGHAGFRALRRELDLHLRVRQALHGFDQAGYRTLLAHLSRSSAQTLGKYTRDEMLKLLTKLLLRQPRLLVLGLRSILFHRASSGR